MHLEKIVIAIFRQRDANEFRRDWAKEKSYSILASTIAEDEEDELVDFKKTINDEGNAGSLGSKKDFLTVFLKRKLIELSEYQVTERTLGEGMKTDKKIGKTVRYRDKTFRLLEVNSDDSDTDDIGKHDDSDLEEKIFCAIYRMNGKVQKGKGQRQGKWEKPKYKQKTCPIQCGREHSNGSVYFCKIYREKLLDERKELQKKIPFCITCLSKVNREHKCPVGICSNCWPCTTYYCFLRKELPRH